MRRVKDNFRSTMIASHSVDEQMFRSIISTSRIFKDGVIFTAYNVAVYLSYSMLPANANKCIELI